MARRLRTRSGSTRRPASRSASFRDTEEPYLSVVGTLGLAELSQTSSESSEKLAPMALAAARQISRYGDTRSPT